MSQKYSNSKILVVDDEKSVCQSLKEFLDIEGYIVETANDGEEALAKQGKFNPDCILLDVRMPYLNGVDALGMIKMRTPFVQIIMVSAVQNVSTAEKCMAQGAFAYIHKPIKLDELLDTIERALEAREEAMVEFVPEESKQVEGSTQKRCDKSGDLIQFLNDEVFNSLKFCLDILEYSDPQLAWHSKNVAWLSVGIAKELNLDHMRLIELAALFHDIGKLPLRHQLPYIPVREMSPEQQKVYYRYPVFGQEILQAHTHIGDVGKIVRHQCEYVNGDGFPDGLRGNEIPIGSKVICVANAFDEMLNMDSSGNIEIDIAHMSIDLPLKVLEKEAGKKFDVGVISGLTQFLESYMKNPKKENSVELSSLKPGMVLSRDILTENGKPVFIKGNVFSNSQIEELLEIRDLHIVNKDVKIYG